MRQALKGYLTKAPTIIGIVTAMMFQIIFSLIWMTGYQGVTDRTKQLTIALVNEDRGMGQKVAEQLQATVPFGWSVETSLAEAAAKLERRDVQMVLHLPADFSKKLQTPGMQSEIEYTINESNPAQIKSMMQSVAAGITAAVGKEAAASGAQAALVQAKVPAEQAGAVAKSVTDKVVSKFDFTNPVQGMNNQMVPMMLVLASYVGAMIMGMNVQQATSMLPAAISKWNRFGARVVINVISSLVIALVAMTLVTSLGGQTSAGFVSVWLFQALFLLTFMFFSQMFLMVFGMAGMLFNIAMLSFQLVSSGAMVPRELLNGFYQSLGDYLPATYAVEGGMNLLFGGPSAAGAAGGLIAIMLVCIGVGLLATGLRPIAAAQAAASPAPAAPTAGGEAMTP